MVNKKPPRWTLKYLQRKPCVLPWTFQWVLKPLKPLHRICPFNLDLLVRWCGWKKIKQVPGEKIVIYLGRTQTKITWNISKSEWQPSTLSKFQLAPQATQLELSHCWRCNKSNRKKTATPGIFQFWKGSQKWYIVDKSGVEYLPGLEWSQSERWRMIWNLSGDGNGRQNHCAFECCGVVV